MPRPLERVLAKYGLGRFRVVQKANLDDARDVYRTENARPEDWVMLGTHDTKPAFLVAQTWTATPVGARWARHLGNRLAVAEEITRGGAGAIVHALFADMCSSQARNVMVFFSDLFGLLDVYNIPGTIDEANWSLRLTPDFEARYLDKIRHGAALNLPHALAMALEARDDGQHDELIAALWSLSHELEQLSAFSGVS
jgi:4-alpha-glucanotransferase